MTVTQMTYAETVRRLWPHAGIWDTLDYAHGRLTLHGLAVGDLARRYGTPLEIVDTTMIERRAREWQALAQAVADRVGYPGQLDYLYAGKANLASEVVAAALRAGWGAETSASQELGHLEWLRDRGLMDPDTRVVCNGFKLPTTHLGLPDPERDVTIPAGDLHSVDLPGTPGFRLHEESYADRIVRLAGKGWRIQPVLDAGELATFAGADKPPMDVGIRLKFGKAGTRDALGQVVSRFGLSYDAALELADAIRAAPNLRLTTLHTMVGAAESIPVDAFVDSLALAGRLWAEARSQHPDLVELNVGGGVPPLGEPYDHEALLEGLYRVMAEAAKNRGVPAPNVTFEFGSLVTAEAGYHVFKVIQWKRNHTDTASDAGPEWWAILDGGLMAAIPDMLFLDKAFRCLAAEHAEAPVRNVRLGDVTCDGDGRYPPEAFGANAGIPMPDVGEAASPVSRSAGPVSGSTGSDEQDSDQPDSDQYVVIAGVGAYQEILAGVRGAHHCGLLEAAELILEERDGRLTGRLQPRQTHAEAAAVLGFTEEAAIALREARGG